MNCFKPLPVSATRFIEENNNFIKLLNKLNDKKLKLEQHDEALASLREFKLNLRTHFSDNVAEGEANDTNNEWPDLFDRIIAFGPNVLVDAYSPTSMTGSVWSLLDSLSNRDAGQQQQSDISDFERNLIFGFDLATSKGPLCEEPMQGVAFIVEKLHFNNNNDSTSLLKDDFDQLNLSNGKEKDEEGGGGGEEEAETDNASSIAESTATSLSASIGARTATTSTTSSQYISVIKDACKRAFKRQPMRLMAAMFKCEILVVDPEVLGKLYAVLGKRNAKILDETFKDGTNMFLISSYIPVSDSFGLADEIRKKTSGLASPHIEFSHFEVIELDPFWEPTTEEEILRYGEKADFENQARKYMNEVRKRKGLLVKEKLVAHAEKQRTLKI